MAEERNSLKQQLERLARLYCGQVLPLRTRTVELLGRKCQARIQYSFLGYEVKMGRKRVTCPDNVTARYVKMFAELGLKRVEIPYDPTRTAALLPRLEKAFTAIDEALGSPDMPRPRRQAAQRKAYSKARQLLRACRDQAGTRHGEKH
ncbi:MAG TPA: hypothetical protein VLV83_13355 [Acidobacteriota bacterium]|nr:hypothetical protein [Acidobacteriota bacterium]